MKIAKSFLSKLTFGKSIAIVSIAIGLYSVYIRFTKGLGASTNLTDEFPWGLWVGFNILSGVGLATGGFLIIGLVYIFNIKDFKPIIKPVILTTFLSYLLAIVALLFELGRPDKIWHTLVMWNPRSVMFEVAWCVTLYTIVLALEFSPVVLGRLGWKIPFRIVELLTIPLAILGIILSILHQSSLGSLYLIVPNKLYALWYSALLPILFFLTALSAGCGMIIIESYLSAKAFKRELKFSLLYKVGKLMIIFVLVNWLVKYIDLANRNVLDLLFVPRYETYLYWLEVLLGLIIPFFFWINKKIRNSVVGLFYTAVFIVFGFILNRMNVTITGILESSESFYTPSWMEVSITIGLVSVGFVTFAVVGKHFPLFSENEDHILKNEVEK